MKIASHLYHVSILTLVFACSPNSQASDRAAAIANEAGQTAGKISRFFSGIYENTRAVLLDTTARVELEAQQKSQTWEDMKAKAIYDAEKVYYDMDYEFRKGFNRQ